jgi:hypothetical protein
MMKSKIIVTDIDMVCLSWASAFIDYLGAFGISPVEGKEHLYNMDEVFNIDIKTMDKFKESFSRDTHFGEMPSMLKSVEYIKRIHDEFGIKFHAVTAVPDNEITVNLRDSNIKKLFGDAFFKIDHVGDIDKSHYLEQYRNTGCLWIEDSIKNSIIGAKMGLRSILINQPYNIDEVIDPKYEIQRCDDWEDIYNIVKDGF